jgi:hypothetical protein
MLNGKSYQEHFTDDTASAAPTRTRSPYSAELLEVLAALEGELRLIVHQIAPPPKPPSKQRRRREGLAERRDNGG